MEQISKYIGRTVSVKLEGDEKIEGTLCFFNFQHQVIHLGRYTEYTSEGTSKGGCFKVINAKEWKTIEIKEE